MWRGILKKTKQKDFKGRIYGLDIETTGRKNKFYMGSIYGDDIQKIFYDKQEMMDFLKTKRFMGSYVVATNLGFDYMGLFHNSKEIKHFDTLFRGSDMIFARSFLFNKGFHLRSKDITKDGKSHHGGRITFIDTFNYAKLSVERLGKILNVKKLDKPSFLGKLPKNDEEKKILEDYNLRDSEISQKFIKFLFNVFERLGATPKMTIASTSMSLFKNKYLKEEYFRHPPDELLEQFKAYYGGRTEAFCRGKIKNYNYYDFNSLYPDAMLNHFPDPNTKRITYKNTLNYINEYEGVSSVDIYCPYMKYPLLPYRREDKLVFPTGNFSGWYSHVELRKALSLGYVIKKVNKTYYFKGVCTPFREYVLDLYKLRNEYKKENNPMEIVVKLLLNSLYGKFGQKFIDRDNWRPFNLTIDELDKLEKFERFGDYIRICNKEVEPSAFCIPIWALYVTAYGRIKLYDAIIESEPVYVDTDSLVTKKVMKTSNELGDLKLEMTVNKGLIVKPKFYAFGSDEGDFVKIKGIGRKLTYEEFENVLDNPKITYDKFTKFKESIRRNLMPNEILEVCKNLTLEDNKRCWVDQFNYHVIQDSEPLEVEE